MTSVQHGRTAGNRAGALQTLNSLSTLAETPVSAVLLVGMSGSLAPEITQLQTTAAAARPLSQLTSDATKLYIACELMDYMPAGTTADGQAMWLSLDAVPLLQQVLVDSTDLANLERFDPRRHTATSLRLAAMRVEDAASSAVYIQNLRGSQVIARSTKFGVILRRGVLDVPNGELLILTSDVIAVVTGGYVFFRNRATFQQLFGLMQALQEIASDTLESVTAQLRIEGLEDMERAVTGSPAMLGKMASIQRKLDQYPKYREALTMPKLLAFVHAHPECGVPLTGSGDNTRLVFRNDPQSRFKILKLLDDDYLRSELTTLQYEANSKSFPLTAG